MKVIDGKNAVLGRLASYVAKEALKGENIVVVNCEQVIITGNKRSTKEFFEKKKGRVGSGQKGPKHSLTSEKIVKRTIRGMLPNHRKGRGKVAFQRIRCHHGIPKEFEDVKKISGKREIKTKFIYVKDISK